MDILQQQDKEYIAGTYARFPLTIEGLDKAMRELAR